MTPPGFPTREEIRAGGRWLTTIQQPDGALPWEPGRHTDPWNHIEAAMGMDATGFPAEAARAYQWLVDTQTADGGWHASYAPDGRLLDRAMQSGFNGYLAVGVWHHLLVTRDLAWARRMWPNVTAALDWVVDLQLPDGRIGWCRTKKGEIDQGSLVTGSSSLVQSLRTGALLAEVMGDSRPDWELVADRLAHTLREHPGAYMDKSQWAMDWYYPVLCGVLRGTDGAARVDDRWGRFVRPGRGTRCVWHQPWFTVAETAELALVCDVVGRGDAGRQLLADGHRLQLTHAFPGDPVLSWWTGWVDDGSPDGALWPGEQTGWTAGAMILAWDALVGASPGAGIFRDVVASPVLACDENCPLAAGLDPYERAEGAHAGHLGEGA